MGKISKLFNRFSKQQPSLAETGTNEQNRVDDEHEIEEKKVKESNSSLHEEEVTKKEQKKKSDGKAHIYNLIIVDESGSMSHLREVTLSGINETIGTIRNAQNEFAQTQVHTLTLVTFDSDSNRPAVRTMIDNEPIANVKKFRDYMPNGCTPLYDAMGQSLTRLHTLIKGDVDASAVVTVLTDGLENASREWNAQSLRKLIEQLKQEGWSFSYMGSAHNVKEVTDLLSIDNYVEFSHDAVGAMNTWERESASRREYSRYIKEMYSAPRTMSAEVMARMRREYSKRYYNPRVTPDYVSDLKTDEVFVFGSDGAGHHDGGASAFALEHFGAIYGQGEGRQGKSYAIPTTEGLVKLKDAVDTFITYAAAHQDTHFLVTPVGCGVAGFTPYDVAPLFKPCIRMENVSLPKSFWDILGLKM